MKSINETVMKFVFLAAACTSVLAVALICIFLFANGIPAMAKIGLPDFLFGMKWKPSNGLYGIFPFILGSIYAVSYTHLCWGMYGLAGSFSFMYLHQEI